MSWKGRSRTGRKGKRPNKSRSAQSKFKLPRPKKSVVRDLQTIIETKKFCGYENGAIPGPTDVSLSNTAAPTVIVPGAYMQMQSESMGTVTQGASVTGNDLFSRYLSMKVQLQYPVNRFAPTESQPLPVELIWGWVRPMNLTALTAPSDATVSSVEILANVVAQIGGDFDQADDSMEFKNRARRQYNIIGRKMLVPDNNEAVIQNSNFSNAELRGGPPVVHTTISWPTMKKLEYYKSADSGAGGSGVPFIYPNQAYIPFVCLFNPSFASYALNTPDPVTGVHQQRQVHLSTNACHWFNDA